ncbi:MAG TPA: hypothetical protein VHQ41_00280 [Patescibacteria group bacterium]|jgi:hypothetical protein|nr:hypothetical protein [Patescibacteria group bacterium]
MNASQINNIASIVFLVLVGLLALVSLLTAYVLIRYGQKLTFTVIISLAFGAVFFLGALTAFITLQQLF